MSILGVKRCKNAVVLLFVQFIFINVFVGWTSYDADADASDTHNSVHYVYGGFRPESNNILKFYQLFQDVHVMIFIGFGFLMTFLKRYGFSSVGFNFLLAALIVQWALICEGLYNMDSDSKIRIGIVSLLRADVATAAVLISMGAVLGRTSYIQLIVMGMIEIAVFSGNQYLGIEIFKVSDAGDSIFVHAFGAYFGLAVSFILHRRKGDTEEGETMEGSNYTSDLFAMIGTVFLWLFWPSFNAAEQTGDDQHRAVINTYLSLCSCCVTAFGISAAFTPGHKFDMVHIQNATLAGGVAVGTAANLMLQPYGALIVGVLAGALSVFGYSILTPWIDRKMRIHDTCGVHNLHGMPAVLAGLVGALMAGIANEDTYKMSLYQIFPAMAPVDAKPNAEYTFYSSGDGRSSGEQAGYQLLALVVTIAIAIVSGLITGLLISTSVTTLIKSKNQYVDDIYWLIHEPNHLNEKSITAVSTVSEKVVVDPTTEANREHIN